MDGSGTREEPVLKSLRCLPACPSPFPEEQQPVDRTPSPCVGQISFAPNNLDTNFQTQSLENTSSVLSNGIMVRRCTCSRTGCLKLYCDCFAAGQRCSDCCCFGCRNNSEHEELRQKAIDRIMTRKPDAFLSKIGEHFPLLKFRLTDLVITLGRLSVWCEKPHIFVNTLAFDHLDANQPSCRSKVKLIKHPYALG